MLELTDPRAMGPLELVLFLSLLSAVHNSIIHSIGLIKPLELESWKSVMPVDKLLTSS